jgi:hypothetical protein
MRKRYFAIFFVIVLVAVAVVIFINVNDGNDHFYIEMSGQYIQDDKTKAVTAVVSGYIEDDQIRLVIDLDGDIKWSYFPPEGTESTRIKELMGLPYYVNYTMLIGTLQGVAMPYSGAYAFYPEKGLLMIYIYYEKTDSYPVLVLSENGEYTKEEIMEYFSDFVRDFGPPQ